MLQNIHLISLLIQNEVVVKVIMYNFREMLTLQQYSSFKDQNTQIWSSKHHKSFN